MTTTDLYDTERVVTIGGKEYHQVPAKVTSCDLTREDHGCLVLDMAFEGEEGGWGQGLGGLVLDTYDEFGEKRVGVKESMDLVLGLLDHFEVNRLSEIEGRRVYVYRDGPRFQGMIRGFNQRDKRKDVLFPAAFFGEESA